MDVGDIVSTLVINAGSTSIKISVFTQKYKTLVETHAGSIDLISNRLKLNKHVFKSRSKAKAIEQLFFHLHKILEKTSIKTVGHRIVHGGTFFYQNTKIDEQALKKLKKISPLAPLHNPIELKCLKLCKKYWPRAEQRASFDTAFFKDLPEARKCYALSKKLSYKEIIRYGFHGINHKFCLDRLKILYKNSTYKSRIISCHLGGGCSISAIHHNKCVDTTMGFTPLDGCVMGTRPGSLDPGIVLYLIRNKKLSIQSLESELYHKSGLLGLSNFSPHIHEVLKAEKSSANARLAVRVYIESVAKHIIMMMTSLKGCEHLIFTGGAAEHSPEIRRLIIKELKFLNFELNPKKNASQKEGQISSNKSPFKIWLIPAGENEVIAKESLK